MIDSEDIERAERTLQVVYGGDLGRQLRDLQVDREAVDNVLQHGVAIVDRRYQSARRAADPRLESAWMTLCTHMFLLGLICGRNQARMIE